MWPVSYLKDLNLNLNMYPIGCILVEIGLEIMSENLIFMKLSNIPAGVNKTSDQKTNTPKFSNNQSVQRSIYMSVSHAASQFREPRKSVLFMYFGSMALKSCQI